MQSHLAAGEASPAASVQEAARSHAVVQAAGTSHVPTWAEACAGAKPPPPPDGTDPADFDRGWQCHASSFSEQLFLERVVQPNCDRARLTLLLSQSGGAASAWLRAVPSEPAFTLRPLRFHTAVRRRLRWPLPLSGGVCCRTCSQHLDPLGDRAAACPTSGRLKLRSRPLEKTWARVLRESGARVREHVYLRDAALPNVDPEDGGNIEIVATGLCAARGVPLAVDATLVSPLHSDGTPFPHADTSPGVALSRAESTKARTYPELVNSSLLRLWTVAHGIGGRLNGQGAQLLTEAAHTWAMSEPSVLRRTAARNWRTRWTTLLSVAVQDSLAATSPDTFRSYKHHLGSWIRLPL